MGGAAMKIIRWLIMRKYAYLTHSCGDMTAIYKEYERLVEMEIEEAPNCQMTRVGRE